MFLLLHLEVLILIYSRVMNKPLGTGFWQRFDALLTKRRLRQSDITNITGISQSSISSAKSRGTIPSSDVGLKIAKALSTSLTYLVFGEGDSEDLDLEDSFGMIRKSQNSSSIAKILPYLTLEQTLALKTIISTWENAKEIQKELSLNQKDS
jgi:transcriptional regulator with XRE-family HTH domain